MRPQFRYRIREVFHGIPGDRRRRECLDKILEQLDITRNTWSLKINSTYREVENKFCFSTIQLERIALILDEYRETEVTIGSLINTPIPERHIPAS